MSAMAADPMYGSCHTNVTSAPRSSNRPLMRMPRTRMPRTSDRLHVGQLRAQAAERARAARFKLLALAPVLAGVVAAYLYRQRLFGLDEPIRIATAVFLVVVGWAFARQLGSVLQPKLLSRLDPDTAGVAGFGVRLVAIGAIILASLRIAGLEPGTLALGASFTAIVVGLAAQQTIG